MPPSEFIDLSLSTDDEAPLSPSPGHGDKVASKVPVGTRFRSLQDDLDDTVSLDDKTAPLSKRRKINSPPDVQKPGLLVGPAVLGSWESTKKRVQKENSTEEPSSIISTSQDHQSAPLKGLMSAVGPASLITDDSDDSFPEDVIHGRISQAKQRPLLSERTTALLASFDKPAERKKVKSAGQRSKEKTAGSRTHDSLYSEDEVTDLEGNPRPIVAKSSTTVKLTSAEKAARVEERDILRQEGKREERGAGTKETLKRRGAGKKETAKGRESAREAEGCRFSRGKQVQAGQENHGTRNDCRFTSLDRWSWRRYSDSRVSQESTNRSDIVSEPSSEYNQMETKGQEPV